MQEGEAGGITQQIGATYVPMDAIQRRTDSLRKGKDFDMKLPGLLIIDTPGTCWHICSLLKILHCIRMPIIAKARSFLWATGNFFCFARKGLLAVQEDLAGSMYWTEERLIS